MEVGDEGTYMCSGVMEGLNGRSIKLQRTMKLVVARGKYNIIIKFNPESDGAM